MMPWVRTYHKHFRDPHFLSHTTYYCWSKIHLKPHYWWQALYLERVDSLQAEGRCTQDIIMQALISYRVNYITMKLLTCPFFCHITYVALVKCSLPLLMKPQVDHRWAFALLGKFRCNRYLHAAVRTSRAFILREKGNWLFKRKVRRTFKLRGLWELL